MLILVEKKERISCKTGAGYLPKSPSIDTKEGMGGIFWGKRIISERGLE